MAIYSHSKLSTFEQCKYKYKLQYIDKLKVDVPTTIEAFMGSCVHEALEKLYKDLQFRRLLSLDQLIEFYYSVWERDWSDDIVIVKDYKKDDYKRMGVKYLEDYYNEYKPFNQHSVIGLETEERLKLKDGSFYHVRIDRLASSGNAYFVCDYKTNSKMKLQEEADKDRQLAMYSKWVRQHFSDAVHVVLVWHMLAFNKEVTSERSKKELDALEDEVVSLIKEIESTKDFPTNVSALCDYCVFKSVCPSFKHEFALEEKTIKQYKKDEGLKLVNEFASKKEEVQKLEKELDELKLDLIGFCKQEKIDTIYGSNKKVSVKEFEKFNIPEENKEKFVELLKKEGLLDNFSSISWVKVYSNLSEGNLGKEFTKLSKKEKDFRISLSKKKDEEED